MVIKTGNQYIFSKSIIAIFKLKNDQKYGFAYYDITNRLDLWHRFYLDNYLEIEEYIDFYELDSSKDSIYSSVKINKEYVKYIISTDEGLSKIFLTGKNLFFIDNNNIENTANKINIGLKKLTIPLWGDCYINPLMINKIQTEDYITVNPEAIDVYLDNKNCSEKIELFHIVFQDTSELTVCENSIDEMLIKIGEKII